MLAVIVSAIAVGVALIALAVMLGVVFRHGNRFRKPKKLAKWEAERIGRAAAEEEEQMQEAPKSQQDVNKLESIPRKIHFVYGLFDDGKKIPQEFLDNMQRFTRVNPTYATLLWDRQQCEGLIDRHFPEFADLYKGFERNIQRADLLRYLIVKRHGGWYFDLDCRCIGKSIEELLEETGMKTSRRGRPTFVGFVEKVISENTAKKCAEDNSIRGGVPEDAGMRLANYAFGSTSNHPLWEDLLKELKSRCADAKVASDYDVYFTTGPDCFTHVVNRTKHDVAIVSKDESDAFVRHKAIGSWKTDKRKNNNRSRTSKVADDEDEFCLVTTEDEEEEAKRS